MDITLGETRYIRFTTRNTSGVPTQLAGTPVIAAYENDSDVQITAGITLGVDHDSVTGLNLLTIVATGGNGFEAGKEYDLVITTGTVGGTSVVGEVVGHFTIERGAAFTRLGAPAAASVSADILAIDNFVDELESRLTATRAGYLDKLNITGNVAGSDEVTSIQNNTRVVRVVPTVAERPDSGSYVVRIELLLYDSVGNMEAPDSAPTIAAVDESGNTRDANLDATTMTLVSTGRYRSTYTIADSHDIEQIIITFSVVEGGNTRTYGNTMLVVDTTAVDFTSADRAKLDTLHDTRLTAARASNLDNLDAPISTVDANVDAILNDTDVTIPGLIAALNDITVADILTGIVEGTITVQQSLMLANAANAGETNGFVPGTSGTGNIRNPADDKNRIQATYDENGNRTGVTTDLS